MKQSPALAIILFVAFTISLVAQEPPSPAGQSPAQGQGQGRGQGRGQGGGGGRRGAGPQRDAAIPTGTGVIAGTVVAADTGRAVKRARVVVLGGGRPHASSTDDQGRYKVTGLPAATYTITATKSGFVAGAFGQRRSARTGTPVELADGQQAVNIDLKLARGGVVTGRVLDEEGEPLARAVVTVLRQQYLRGEKQLTPVGGDQSDDRGQYRIFGLPPGDYYVSATAGGIEQIVRQVVGESGGIDQAAESTGYAPTYYPGVITAGDATRLKLAAAQELTSIDFQVQIVPLATVKGVVVGGPANVVLVPEDGSAAGALGGALASLGGSFGALGGGGGRAAGRGGLAGGRGRRASTRQDGTFTISSVTPGKYTIVARADGGPNGGGLRTAMQTLLITGGEVNVALTPAPGVQLSGSMTLEAAGPAPPDAFTRFRITPSPLGSAATMPGGGRGGRLRDAGESGQFAINDVMPGLYVIRAAAPQGWTMKSVYLDGRDVTDIPIEVKSENVSGLNVIFTDKISSLTGTVRDSRGNPATDVTVIAFPADERQWLPLSRQILTARTNSAGAYRLASIPPGDYLFVAVDDVEQGEWYDPTFLDQMKDQATKVKVAEGEQRTQDLKARSM